MDSDKHARSTCGVPDLRQQLVRRCVLNAGRGMVTVDCARSRSAPTNHRRRRPSIAPSLSPTRAREATVTHTRCPHARARGWAARCRPTCSTCSGRLGGAAAAGRTMVRSPAAPSPVRFSGLLFAKFGGGRWSSGGTVTHTRCPHARARGWAARCRPTCSTCSGRLGGAAAAGRTMVRSPAAPSPVRFSGLLFANSGADDGARAVGATDDDDVGFA